MIPIAAVSALASLASGAISMYANRKAQANMEDYRNYLVARKAENDQKIQKLENEDALETKQGRALATEARETLQEQNTAAAGRDAVMGGTGVNTAKVKAANADILRKTYRDIMARHEATTGARISNLEGIRANYDNLIAQGKMQQANANTQAAAAAAKGIVGAVQAGAMAYAAEPTSHNGTDENIYGVDQKKIKEGDPYTDYDTTA